MGQAAGLLPRPCSLLLTLACCWWCCLAAELEARALCPWPARDHRRACQAMCRLARFLQIKHWRDAQAYPWKPASKAQCST